MNDIKSAGLNRHFSSHYTSQGALIKSHLANQKEHTHVKIDGGKIKKKRAKAQQIERKKKWLMKQCMKEVGFALSSSGNK